MWNKYRKLRDEITGEVRKVKFQYVCNVTLMLLTQGRVGKY